MAAPRRRHNISRTGQLVAAVSVLLLGAVAWYFTADSVRSLLRSTRLSHARAHLPPCSPTETRRGRYERRQYHIIINITPSSSPTFPLLLPFTLSHPRLQYRSSWPFSSFLFPANTLIHTHSYPPPQSSYNSPPTTPSISSSLPPRVLPSPSPLPTISPRKQAWKSSELSRIKRAKGWCMS